MDCYKEPLIRIEKSLLAAAKALENALSDTSGSEQTAVCEGLFRCAEAMAADGQTAASRAIYDRVRGLVRQSARAIGGGVEVGGPFRD